MYSWDPNTGYLNYETIGLTDFKIVGYPIVVLVFKGALIPGPVNKTQFVFWTFFSLVMRGPLIILPRPSGSPYQK